MSAKVQTTEQVVSSTPLEALFEHITIPSDQSFLWRMDDYPWRRNVWNYHPEFEIHYIRASTGLCYIGDHIGPFEPGHLVMIGSNLPHNWITLPANAELVKNRDIVIQFKPDEILKAGSGFPEMEGLRKLFDRATVGTEYFGEASRIGGALLENMANTKGLRRLSQLMELMHLMLETNESKPLATPQYVSRFKPGSSSELHRLELTLNYIQEHYRSNLRLGEVAKLAGMSESSFSRFFKTQTGNAFSDHIQILRIWTAKKLLKETDTPITDICFEAGFSNISNFNRAFLRHTNMRPSEYRKASRRI